MYVAGRSFCDRIVQAAVRCSWASHSYCYVVVLDVKPVQLEMGSLRIDPAGAISTRWCVHEDPTEALFDNVSKFR